MLIEVAQATAAFVFLMVVVVGVHEYGHFLVARLAGVEVSKFSIGFGPALISHTSKRTGILYALRLIPLGGAVQVKTDGANSVRSLRLLPKVAFYAAGPFANVILAFGMFATLHATDVIRPIDPVITEFTSPSPAQAAGLAIGDRLLSIDGFATRTWIDVLLNGAMANPDKPAIVEVERGGKQLSFTLMRDGTRLGLIGHAQKDPSTLPHALSLAAQDIRVHLTQIITVPRMLIYYGRNPVSKFSGPVGVAGAAGTAANSELPVLQLAILLAGLSCGLAAANLLPIPIMDGGRIVQAVVERLFNSATSARIETFLAYASIAILLTLLAITTSNDIARALHRPELF